MICMQAATHHGALCIFKVLQISYQTTKLGSKSELRCVAYTFSLYGNKKS